MESFAFCELTKHQVLENFKIDFSNVFLEIGKATGLQKLSPNFGNKVFFYFKISKKVIFKSCLGNQIMKTKFISCASPIYKIHLKSPFYFFSI